MVHSFPTRRSSDLLRLGVGADGAATVTDGPYAEAKEVVGGYWLIQARSKDEAVEWARRCPCENCRIEVRRVQEMEDFSPEIQEAAESAE